MWCGRDMNKTYFISRDQSDDISYNKMKWCQERFQRVFREVKDKNCNKRKSPINEMFYYFGILNMISRSGNIMF